MNNDIKNKKNKYDISSLIKIFNGHIKDLENSSHYKEGDFNLPRALSAMCQEIEFLKKKT